MKDLKEIIYVIIGVTAGLILIWWLGQGIAWSKNRIDQQRAKCVAATHDGYYCNSAW